MSAAVEALLRRDLLVVAAALAVMTALAWAHLWLAADMDMGGMDNGA
jgi:predicted metal-binding membrane protein